MVKDGQVRKLWAENDLCLRFRKTHSRVLTYVICENDLCLRFRKTHSRVLTYVI
jgi:hypothetical protein